MTRILTASDLARLFHVKPQIISQIFYARLIDDSLAPIQGGRRRIPDSLIPTIREVLEQQGHLPATPTTHMELSTH